MELRVNRVWLTTKEKIVVSKDVIFNEQSFFKDLEKESSRDEELPASNWDKRKKKVSFKSDLVKFEEDDPSSGGADSESINRLQRNEQGESLGTSTQEEAEVSDDEADTEPTQTEDFGSYVLDRDRQRRTIRPPSKFEDTDFLAYALASAEELETGEPRSYKEAIQSKASDEEMESLEKNQTWDYVERPKDHKVIGCKWIYKLKPGIPGVEKPRHKSRSVAKGYAQTEGIDYNEVFAPVVKHVSIRHLLLAVVNYDLELE